MTPDSKRMALSALRIVILASIAGLALQVTKDPNGDTDLVTSAAVEVIVGFIIASACVGSIITLIAVDILSWLNRNKK